MAIGSYALAPGDLIAIVALAISFAAAASTLAEREARFGRLTEFRGDAAIETDGSSP
jgi:hypothetical protein